MLIGLIDKLTDCLRNGGCVLVNKEMIGMALTVVESPGE